MHPVLEPLTDGYSDLVAVNIGATGFFRVAIVGTDQDDVGELFFNSHLYARSSDNGC